MACHQQQQSDEPVSENSMPEASSSSGMLNVRYLLLMNIILLNYLACFQSFWQIAVNVHVIGMLGPLQASSTAAVTYDTDSTAASGEVGRLQGQYV